MADVVWWHSRRRVVICVATSVVLAAAIAVLVVANQDRAAGVVTWLLVLTLLMQLRPVFYARLRRGREILRVGTVVLFFIPIVSIGVDDPPAPIDSILLSLTFGVVAGVLLLGFHIFDLRVLLDREIIAMQPRMSLAGALSRVAYVAVVIPLEELFYRRLLLAALLPIVGTVPAVLIAIASFVYGDWSGSWGPNSRVKRLIAEACLAAATALIYLATGSIWGAILAHAIYNSSQFILPIRNLLVHRRVPYVPEVTA
ncbi:CPBP family glutamic-type intramembrane protease [Microbacterium sp. A8/3-1]|uniref:CPBP family glutamic-type intramembrane protease n=1 Tax=Microbacterium sp. A8/3-1 TaxID=3160749 RepID=A0AAU7W0D3_9MICO